MARTKRARRPKGGVRTMDEQKPQETARRPQETARPQESARPHETARPQETARRQERATDGGAEAARVASQLTELGTQTVGLWADVNQKVMRDLMEVSTNTMREGARLAMSMQETQLDAARELQSAAWRWWL